MNRKPFFYIMIFFLTFIFANVIRNIISGEPLENYLIYALVGLFILASIISDFIRSLWMEQRARLQWAAG